MIRIDTIEEPSRFASLRAEWNELLSDSDANGLFLTWEWMHSWWRNLAEDRRLRIITVRRDRQLIAIAPLARRSRRWSRLIPFPALEFIGAGEAGSDHLDVLVRRGHERQAVFALAESLAGDGLMLELSRVRGEGPQVSELASEIGRWGWVSSHTPVDVCPYIDLAGHDWQSYLATLGSSHRYNLRRRIKNLEKDRTLTFECVANERQRAAALEELIMLHQQRWLRRGHSGAFHSRELRAFHHEVSRIALERGWLRLYSLKVDGRTAAAIYGFRYGGVFYFYQSCFEPEFQQHSVGLVIMGMAIKRAIEEGAHTYDFLCGDETYKSLWTDRKRPLMRLVMYPPGQRGALYRQTMGLRGSIKKMAMRLSPADPA